MRIKFKLVFWCFYSLFNCYHLSASPELLKSKTKFIKKGFCNSIINSDTVFNKKYVFLLNRFKKEEFTATLREALALSDSIKNKGNYHQLFLIKTLIGDIYEQVNKHKRALSSYKEALFFIENNPFLDGSINSRNDSDLAKIFLKIGSSFQKESINDSATYYLKKTENLSFKNPEVRAYQAIAFSNLSGIYQTDSLFDKAIAYANKSLKINKEINNKIGQAAVLNNLANIYMSSKNYDKAKEFYLQGISLIRNDNSQRAVKQKADLYYNLAWAMRNLKEYKAYDFQELSYEIEDDIRDKEYRQMVAKIAAENDVQTVIKEEENKRLKQNSTFWIFIIFGSIVIISLLYWLSLNRLKQRNLALKLSQTQLLQNQNIEKIKSESQTRILNATIDGKESERKEIAETLHDSVSALLSSANLHLMATKSQFKGDAPIEIDKTQQIIAEASLKIRDLSHTLVSSVLLKFGLNFALKDMATKYSNSVLYIETDIYNLRRYHQNFEIKVYNIIQEFINNILKHSKAENAFIKLYEQDNNICFQISDDGVGFDKTKITNKDGLGLNQIDARIQMMHGDFLVESTIGEGTTVYVKLPIIEKINVSRV